MTAVLTTPVIVQRPTAASREEVTLQRLIEWCQDQADELIESDKQFAWISSACFLSHQFQWAIVNTFNDKQYKIIADFLIQNLENFWKLIFSEQWKFAEWEEKLLKFLWLNVDNIITEWSNEIKKKKKYDDK